MLLVINSLRGRQTTTHTDVPDKSSFKKPGICHPVAVHARLNNFLNIKCSQAYCSQGFRPVNI